MSEAGDHSGMETSSWALVFVWESPLPRNVGSFQLELGCAMWGLEEPCLRTKRGGPLVVTGANPARVPPQGSAVGFYIQHFIHPSALWAYRWGLEVERWP